MPETSPPKPPLIFDWRKPKGQLGRLFLWIAVTAVALTVFFFLFRVVYPQTQRFVPVTQQIVVLNSSDPATLASINHVTDRDFMVLPSRDSRSGTVNLEERTPVFHPLYEKHELKLQDVPQRNSTVPPVRLLDVTAPILPDLDLSELQRHHPVKIATTATKLDLQVSGDLAARKIIFRPEFPTPVISTPEAWLFVIGVNATGRVIFALPSGNPEKNADANRLLALLQQIKFEPNAAQSKDTPSWGIAFLNWVAPVTEP